MTRKSEMATAKSPALLAFLLPLAARDGTSSLSPLVSWRSYSVSASRRSGSTEMKASGSAAVRLLSTLSRPISKLRCGPSRYGL